MRSRSAPASRLILAILLASTAVVSGQKSASGTDPAGPPRGTESELRDLVDRYSDDRIALLRRYPVDLSPERTARLKKYYAGWQARVASVDYEPLSVEGRIDHIVLRRRIATESRLIEREEKWRAETAELLPFAGAILALNDARMRMETLDPEKAAAALDKLAAQIDTTRRGVDAAPKAAKLVAFRAQNSLKALTTAL